jgi:hypothetical protein
MMNRTAVAKVLGLTYKEVLDAERSGLAKLRAYCYTAGIRIEDFLGAEDPPLPLDVDNLEEPDDDSERPDERAGARAVALARPRSRGTP